MELAARLEQSGERTADGREHDVVHRAAERVADFLGDVERHPYELEPALGPDARVQRQTRRERVPPDQRAEGTGEAADLIDDLLRCIRRVATGADDPGRLRDPLAHGVEHEPRRVGRGRRLPRWRVEHRRLGGEVEEDGRDVDTRHAVRERVVRLVDQPHVPAVVEALDEPQLPQRPVAVEELAHQALGQREEVAPAPRLRELGEVHVAGDVEAVVVDPHRVPDTERHVHDPPPEARDQVQARPDQLADVVEAEAAAVVEEGRAVEHRDRADLHRRLAPLEVQEARVEGGQAVVLGRHCARVRPAAPPPTAERVPCGVMSLSATCVWHVDPDVVLALDAQLGPPVDSYVNGTQTWLTEDGPGGIALEWRLHPVSGYRPPAGLSHYDLWEQVVGALSAGADAGALQLGTEHRELASLWKGSSASPRTATTSSPRRSRLPRPPRSATHPTRRASSITTASARRGSRRWARCRS